MLLLRQYLNDKLFHIMVTKILKAFLKTFFEKQEYPLFLYKKDHF